jgi:hypothetical protein
VITNVEDSVASRDLQAFLVCSELLLAQRLFYGCELGNPRKPAAEVHSQPFFAKRDTHVIRTIERWEAAPPFSSTFEPYRTQ